jgi:hypothetical protein
MFYVNFFAAHHSLNDSTFDVVMIIKLHLYLVQEMIEVIIIGLTII